MATMTVQEMSDEMDVPERTIRNAIERAFPGLMQRGKPTYLSEVQVSIVSHELKQAHNTELASTGRVILTALEKQKIIRQAAALQDEIIADLEATVAIQAEKIRLDAPKVYQAEAIARSDRNFSITEACKFFNIHPKTQAFPFLRVKGYLTSRDLPSQIALDADILVQRDNADGFGHVRSQAVVEDRQLAVWTDYLVPRILEWVKEGM